MHKNGRGQFSGYFISIRSIPLAWRVNLLRYFSMQHRTFVLEIINTHPAANFEIINLLCVKRQLIIRWQE